MKFRKVSPNRYIKLRIIATLIDYAIYFTIYYIYILCVGKEDDSGSLVVKNLAAFPLFIIWFLYFVVVEAYNQSTPGHDICKLIVVKTDGQKINLGDAFKRRIVDIIDIGVYGIPALICIYNTPMYQRLGDLLAGTLVVKKTDITETEVEF